MKYQEIEGNLIILAKQGAFDVITHGCNCFCTMGAGIAVDMAREFGCNEFELERTEEIEINEDWYGEHRYPTKNKGDVNKMGQIDYEIKYLWFKHPRAKDGLAIPMNHMTIGQQNVKKVIVVNSYTQYGFGNPKSDLDYEALTLCLRKINSKFKGMSIGLPKIGAGLAGGDWSRIKQIIQNELKNMDITVVIYKP